MMFGAHCDNSVQMAEAMFFQRPVTLVRDRNGDKLAKPYTMNYRPAMAKCKSWTA